MTAKVGVWMLGGLAALATAVGVWAQIPDSMLNRRIDQARAEQAHGRLESVSDTRPLGGRYPIIAILGLNNSTDEDGPSAEELTRMIVKTLPDTAGIYSSWRPGHDFGQEVKVYGYWYNSNASPEVVAGWFNALVENHSELSQVKLRFSAWGHSMGGKVMYCYRIKTKDRRLDAKVPAGTPFLGALLADPQATDQAIDASYPTLIAKQAKQQAAKRQIDFTASGLQWLRLDYPPMLQLLERYPLDDSWTLIAGETTPSKPGLTKYIDLGIWLDRALLEQSQDQDFKAYQVGAYVLQQGGIKEGSDGVVGINSAACDGFSGDAEVIVLEDHNHSQMWWGNGGMELRRAMLRPVMPYIIAHQEAQLSRPEFDFDLWLPELPTLNLPKAQLIDLEQARLVWVEDGRLVVSGETVINPIALRLGGGRFEWPQWSGDDLVATWHHDGGLDIVRVRADTGQMVQITTDGKSRMVGAQDRDDGCMVAFESGDLMVMDVVSGLARVLVEGPLSLTSPPIFVGNRLYFAIDQSGVQEVRWVNPKLSHRSLQQTALVESVTTCPMRLGVAALALKEVDNSDTELVLISPWWTGKVPVGRQVVSVADALQAIGMPPVTWVDVSSQSGTVYLVVGEDGICQLDPVLTLQSFSANIPTVDSWQKVAKPIATGWQLDVK